MDRRSFLRSVPAAAAAVSLGSPKTASMAGARANQEPDSPEPFQLDYAPSSGQFRQSAGKNLNGIESYLAQVEWSYEHGFRSWEDNTMKSRSVEDQNKIASKMEQLGMRMGVFVANFGTAFQPQTFTSGKKEALENFLNDLRDSVEVAKRVNAKWMTIVLGTRDPSLPIGYQHANAIEMLRRGAEIFEPHNLTMVMEPLNPINHPDMYLAHSDHAYMLCKAVRSPAVKILFDIYHQAISEGDLWRNIERCWDETPYFQIGDNPGRKEPYTGEVNFNELFRRIHAKGFQGILGMEHGTSQGGLEGERKLLAAYRRADQF
ncbi:MAG: TIM barrel protein [Planctomycetes bacterium]|nr:TIM barrel protein [Planctomycetota bacterium]